MAGGQLAAYRMKHLYLPLMLLIATFVVMWLIFGYWISRGIFWLKLSEMNTVFSFYNLFYFYDVNSPDIIAQMKANPDNWTWGIKLYNLKYALVNYESMHLSGNAFKIWDLIKVFWFFNGYLMPFYALFGVAIFWWGYNKMNGNLFTEKYTMDSLIVREKDLYPELHPLVDQELVMTYNLIDDRWAPPLNEYEFVRRHNLLIQGRDNQWIDEHGNSFQKLDYLKTKQVFDKQLGPRFYGFENMQPHRKAMFALIGVMLNKNTDSVNYKEDYCIKQARKLSRAFALKGNKFDVKDPDMYGEWVEEYYNMFKDLDRYKKYILCRHAYELTVFASLYSAALNFQSVLPTSYFKWLKIVDRELYFVLNSIGRQNVYFVEVAGVMTHWLVEFDSGMPQILPKTKNAVKALESELRKYKDEEPDEHYFRKR